MKKRLPKPPLAIAIPALGYLAFEASVLWSTPGMTRLIRFSVATILIFGVILQNRIALPVWALSSLFAALVFTRSAFGALRTDVAESAMYALLSAAAFINAGYLFFYHAPRSHDAHAGNQ
jgi:hypothetical protein